MFHFNIIEVFFSIGQELEQSMKSLNMMMLQKDGSYKNLPIGLTPVSFKRDVSIV